MPSSSEPINPESKVLKERLLALPESQFVSEFIHPLAFQILARTRAEARRIRMPDSEVAKDQDHEKVNWGSFELPPAPGTEESVRLIWIDPGRGGCSHQTWTGGCWGCDYHGTQERRTEDDLLTVVDKIFNDLDSGELSKFFKERSRVELNIIASGSLLSPEEVPQTVLGKIFSKTKEYKSDHPEKEVFFETEARLDDLTVYNPIEAKWVVRADLLKQLHEFGQALGDGLGRVNIGIGLESTSPLVAEGCINKSLPPIEEIIKLQQLLGADYPAVSFLPHIWLGTNFLSEKEMIDDTVSSVKDCFEKGLVDSHGRIILMVMNDRPKSPLGMLKGELSDLVERRILPPFELPSVWSVGKVLLDLGYEKAKKVMIRGFTTSEPDVEVVGPCKEECEESNRLFTLVKNWQGSEKQWQQLESLYTQTPENPIDCKSSWENRTESNWPVSLKERLYEIMNILSEPLLGKQISDELIERGKMKVNSIQELKFRHRFLK